jgi:hypothetical protein
VAISNTSAKNGGGIALVNGAYLELWNVATLCTNTMATQSGGCVYLSQTNSMLDGGLYIN